MPRDYRRGFRVANACVTRARRLRAGRGGVVGAPVRATREAHSQVIGTGKAPTRRETPLERRGKKPGPATLRHGTRADAWVELRVVACCELCW